MCVSVIERERERERVRGREGVRAARRARVSESVVRVNRTLGSVVHWNEERCREFSFTPKKNKPVQVQ